MQRHVPSSLMHPASTQPEAELNSFKPVLVPMTPQSGQAHPYQWPLAAALVLSTIFWLLAWYGDTAASIVSIWARSETFVHGFLIAPISAWLIWRKRHELASLKPQPNFLVITVLALIGLGWLSARLADVVVIQQYSVVIMIGLVVWAILGTRIASRLAFPLFFLLLSVPVGEFLLPIMMQYTADFTVSALRLSGVPVYREGLFFITPTGNWSVVEACSGLRYLIASVTLGFLYAYLTYHSLTRRAVFVVVSALVPIVANWIRAYMIVMVGHLSGMKYAVGVDHLLYGWLFFGIVMLLLFWVGSFWRDVEKVKQGPALDSVPPKLHPRQSLAGVMVATVMSAAVVVIWPAVASQLEEKGSYTAPLLEIPLVSGGWQLTSVPLAEWTPGFVNPTARFNQTYSKGGTEVALYFGYYRNQRQGAQLITTSNALLLRNERAWRNIDDAERSVVSGQYKITVNEAQLRSASTQILVWRWYWVGGRYTANPYAGKVLQAWSQLLGRGDDAAVVIVYTKMDGGREAGAAKLQAFLDAMLPAIGHSLTNAR